MASIREPIKYTAPRFRVLLVVMLVSACKPATPAPILELTPITGSEAPNTVASPTPDPCTGWTCTVHGVVYSQAVQPGNELEGIRLTLMHNSNCSPTRGERQSQTDSEGMFSFDQIYFHDTDRIQILIEVEGSASVIWDSRGTYCYYCSCFNETLEIVLPPASE